MGQRVAPSAVLTELPGVERDVVERLDLHPLIEPRRLCVSQALADRRHRRAALADRKMIAVPAEPMIGAH